MKFRSGLFYFIEYIAVKNKFLLLLAFLVVFIFHIAISFYIYYRNFKDIFDFDLRLLWLIYLKQEDYYLSLSYSIVGVFTYYCYLKFKEKINYSLYGIAGGGIVYAILFLITCFGLRMCGGCPLSYCFTCPLWGGYYIPYAISGIYIFLFGSHVIGIKKSHIFFVSFMLVFLGYLLISGYFRKFFALIYQILTPNPKNKRCDV